MNSAIVAADMAGLHNHAPVAALRQIASHWDHWPGLFAV
jgi:hypothetical protein